MLGRGRGCWLGWPTDGAAAVSRCPWADWPIARRSSPQQIACSVSEQPGAAFEQPPPETMAAAGPTIEHQYFYEDQVYRVNRKGHVEFGMVLENSELASSDENSDTDDGDLHRSGLIKKGHIRVAWHPSAVEEVIPERKVRFTFLFTLFFFNHNPSLPINFT